MDAHRRLFPDEDEMNAIRKEAFDFVGVGLYRYAFDGTVIFMDHNMLRLFEIDDMYADPAMVVGKQIGDLFVYTGPKGRLREEIRKAGFVRNLEYPFKTMKGTKKWALHDSYLVLEPETGEEAIQVIVQDITERRQAEEELRRLYAMLEQRVSERTADLERARAHIEALLVHSMRDVAELEATISAIADGVIIYGPKAEIIRMNHAAEELFGFTPELEQRPFEERLDFYQFETADGKPLAPEEHPPRRALRGEICTGIILAFNKKAEAHRYCLSISAAPIRYPDGNIMGAVATFADITALRELQQRQEDLLHIVSHDLRIPLTVIYGHIQLLEEALQQYRLDGELLLSTSTIHRNVQRMNTMIQDLVEMARLEGHHFALKLDEVHLEHYLADLGRRLSDILPMQRVQCEIPPQLPPVLADYSRLERILLNLLSNAFKYSAEDSMVNIRVQPQDGEVRIAITDQGHGIAPSDLPHLFERFYRGKSARKAEGIGLGLYITRLLVEAHGGRIEVESTPEKGSTFSFTLPVARE